MGTNFYHYEREPCECCNRAYEGKHIGKSSYGWAFSLHVDPHDNIETLDDWRARWAAGGYIEDEYGDRLTIDEMNDRIVNRAYPGGARRHHIDGRFCIGHGDGSWDYMIGEFS